MDKDYSKFSKRRLELLENQYSSEITKLRDKYLETKSRLEKEHTALKNKVAKEIKAFTNKMNKELEVFQNKMNKELETISKQGKRKLQERQKINEVLNNKAFVTEATKSTQIMQNSYSPLTDNSQKTE